MLRESTESTEIILCVSYIPEFRYTVPTTYRPSLPLLKAKKISKLYAAGSAAKCFQCNQIAYNEVTNS